MFRKPSPITEKIIRDIAELKLQIEKIQEIVADPALFETLEKEQKKSL